MYHIAQVSAPATTGTTRGLSRFVEPLSAMPKNSLNWKRGLAGFHSHGTGLKTLASIASLSGAALSTLFLRFAAAICIVLSYGSWEPGALRTLEASSTPIV